VPPLRLVATLGVAGMLAGLLLVFVDQATRGPIAAHRREALSRAVREVLKEPARVESLRVGSARLEREDEVHYEVDSEALDRVFVGYDGEGRAVGFAVAYEKAGFQDAVRLIFGYDPRTKKLLGLKVLESKETPGLGDKIEKDLAWVAQFDGTVAPVQAVKPGKGSGKPDEVDTITGATISSKAVVDIVNLALGRVGDKLTTWMTEEGGP
jgi:electron transport complex protein RnfG